MFTALRPPRLLPFSVPRSNHDFPLRSLSHRWSSSLHRVSPQPETLFSPLFILILPPPPPPLHTPTSFFFPVSPSRFPLPSPSLVVDWVSECLWQLCVVCNRAERLVWIQRWRNLFMWEMHRWRQVSRRRRLSPAVTPHSGADRRSETAKYARHWALNPQAARCDPTDGVFVFIQIWQNDSVCVCIWSA